MSPSRSIQRYGVAVAILVCAADLAVGMVTWRALSLAPHLDVTIQPGADGCDWELAPVSDRGAGQLCVEEIAGVRLRPFTFQPDPGYFTDQGELDGWLADRAALFGNAVGETSVELGVRRPGGTLLSIWSRVSSRTGLVLARSLAVPLAIIVVFVLIALSVVLKRPARLEAWLLLAISQAALAAGLPTLAFSGQGLALPPLESVLLFEVNRVGLPLGTLFLFQLTATFPARRFGARTRLLAFLLPSALCATAITADHLGFPGTSFLAGAVLGGGALVLIVLAQVGRGDPIVKLQARWVLLGFFGPVLAWIVRLGLINVGLAARDSHENLLVLSFVILPVGIALSILRHRLFDIDVVIRRALVGAAVTLVVLFLYSLGLAVFAGGLAGSVRAVPSLPAVFAAALVLAFVLLPVQSRLETALDRVFFRNRFHYRRVLALAPDALARTTNPAEAAETVLEMMTRAMEAPRIVVAFSPAQALGFWQRGADDTGTDLEQPEPFWAEVLDLEGAHVVEPGEETGSLDVWLRRFCLDLAVPLRAEDEVMGILCCAAPRGRLLGAQDLTTLENLAAALALAVSRTQAEAELRTLNAELEERIEARSVELGRVRLEAIRWEKMAGLGALASGLAHELNTPLGVAHSSADQLADRYGRGDAEEKAGRLARLCREGTRRATAIVTDLRDFAGPTTGEVAVVDLGSVVESARILTAPTMESLGATITVRADAVPSFEGFPALLRQTISNLLLNASASAGPGAEIRLSLESSGATARIVVEDDGPGVPADLKERIFEPFYTTRAPGEGSGLGLALCFTFVSQHGGRIWEEGVEGEGARFVVELPLNREAPSAPPSAA